MEQTPKIGPGERRPVTSDCPLRPRAKPPSANAILANLSLREFNQLNSVLHRASLRRGQIIRDIAERIDSLYFPLAGMIGLFAVMSDGRTVVLSATGREGFLGVPALLAAKSAPLRAVTLMGGDAFTLDTGSLESILSDNWEFAAALRRYCGTYLAQIAQIGACHALHTVQQRVALWLLMVRDRSDSDSLPLTHESLSELLGCRRPSVSESLSLLEGAGLVHGSRGEIVITDRSGLSDMACECYTAMRDLATYG